MKIKPNLFLYARLFAALCAMLVCAKATLAGEVTLEDNSILIAFDRDSGALIRLENKSTRWVIERRPELGVSFRLFAPLPNRRYNPSRPRAKATTPWK